MYDTDIGSLPPLTINENYKNYSVKKPMKNGTYISYEVSGLRIDVSKSYVEGKSPVDTFVSQKRYSDFTILREMLSERWIGFFVPALPPK